MFRLPPPVYRHRVLSTALVEPETAAWPPPLSMRVPRATWYHRTGVPFILKPDGSFDVELNDFFSSIELVDLKASTLVRYAANLARFLDFVWFARSDLDARRSWREVDEQDRIAYFHWRNRDPTGSRIAPSTWGLEVVVAKRFYDFQLGRGRLRVSPMRLVTKTVRFGGVPTRVESAAERRAQRAPSAPWFTPGEFERWLRVGVRGYLMSGLRDPRFRGSQNARNTAFAKFLFGTALRLSEGASLLRAEMPESDATVAFRRLQVQAEVAKNGSKRHVYVSSEVVSDLNTYIDSDRSDAVERAQRSGLYEGFPEKIVVRDASQSLSADPETRRRTFIRHSDGALEPVVLWLTESGMPMRPSSWQQIFRVANVRAKSQGLPLRCTPHKLRHSWATITLAQLQRRYNRLRRAPGGSVPLLGDPLDWISRRLGHRDLSTTAVYVHNLEELEAETILELIPEFVPAIEIPRDATVALDTDGFAMSRSGSAAF